MAKVCSGGVHRPSARRRASAQRLNNKDRLTFNFLEPTFSVDEHSF
jgi:hypothetical protein